MIDELVHLFNQGKLAEAIEAGNKAVADNPRDLRVRLVLVQLVCFSGDWERVEKIAKQLATLDPNQEHIELTNFIDQLSIAEHSRRAVWTEGMVPDFVQPPDEVTKKLLWAMSCQRSGETAQYTEALEFVLENAPRINLTIDGTTHKGFRDLDDQTCTVFEAHTIQGSYLWIPHHLVQSIEISRPTRLVDHLWNKARLKLTDDTDLVVYMPGIYFHSFRSDNDALRLGRETAWQDENGIDVGRGRRIFGAGDDEFTLFDFENVTLEASS